MNRYPVPLARSTPMDRLLKRFGPLAGLALLAAVIALVFAVALALAMFYSAIFVGPTLWNVALSIAVICMPLLIIVMAVGSRSSS